MASFEPTVRRQQLGQELRALRKKAGYTLDDAAKVINVSPSLLSRFETGHRAISPVDVSALLGAYGADPTKRDELLALAAESGEIGWWQRPMSYVQQRNSLLMLESKADSITSFDLALIPGLLQTGEYTQALIAARGALPEGESEDTLVSRMCRQSILLRRDPPQLVAIIDELALHRLVGGRDVLRRQLEHLVEESNRPNVSLRVVPNDGQAHSCTDSSFLMIRRPGLCPVVVVETLTAGLFVEDRIEVNTYEATVQELLGRALGAEESVSLVVDLARRLATEESDGWSPATYTT
jgi:transcriptional regulator with XRE-family HTH domain